MRTNSVVNLSYEVSYDIDMLGFSVLINVSPTEANPAVSTVWQPLFFRFFGLQLFCSKLVKMRDGSHLIWWKRGNGNITGVPV